jgi:hypothetical protein
MPTQPELDGGPGGKTKTATEVAVFAPNWILSYRLRDTTFAIYNSAPQTKVKSDLMIF